MGYIVTEHCMNNLSAEEVERRKEALARFIVDFTKKKESEVKKA